MPLSSPLVSTINSSLSVFFCSVSLQITFELARKKRVEIKHAPECTFLLAKTLQFILEIFNVDVLPPCLFALPARLLVLGRCTHDGSC
jgi:hypothetical protein